MIEDFLNGHYENLYIRFGLVFFCWVVVLFSMLVDLYFGIQKSKHLGENSTSEGLRRTVNKTVYYFGMMVFAFLFDLLNPFSSFMAFPLSKLPAFSFLGAIFLVYTEFKSVRKKAEDKLRRRTESDAKELVNNVINLLEKKNDGIDKIARILVRKNNEESNEQNNSDTPTPDNQ